MALPPTLIYEYLGKGPESTYNNLKQAGLLSLRGRIFKKKVIALILDAMEKFREECVGVGPNKDDYIVRALQSSKYLSRKGRRLADTDVRNV